MHMNEWFCEFLVKWINNNSVFYSFCTNVDFIPKKHEGGGGLKKRNQKAIEQKSWKKMERRGYVTLQSFHSNWEQKYSLNHAHLSFLLATDKSPEKIMYWEKIKDKVKKYWQRGLSLDLWFINKHVGHWTHVMLSWVYE